MFVVLIIIITYWLYYNVSVIDSIALYQVLYVTMDNDKELKRLGRKFAKAREAKGLTQTEFANSIGKDQPSINRLEKGNINPSYLYLLEVCEGLKLKLSELLDSF